jgi:5-formyltetrahydrofolate cyclo-ligase
MIPKGSTVCAYVPLKTEPDIRPLLKELLARNDTVYLPCFEGKLVFRRVTSLLALVPGELRIPEPPKDAELLPDNTADIVLVPGRAFDAKGNRLGRGAGGYDRWIAHVRTQEHVPRMIGTAYECQIVNTIPSEPHDEPVDVVVTARGAVESR